MTSLSWTAKPSKYEFDALLVYDVLDYDEIVDLFPELADIQLRIVGDGSIRTLEGMRMRNVFISRKAFFASNYKGNHLFWRIIDSNQHKAGRYGKIIIL